MLDAPLALDYEGLADAVRSAIRELDTEHPWWRDALCREYPGVMRCLNAGTKGSRSSRPSYQREVVVVLVTLFLLVR